MSSFYFFSGGPKLLVQTSHVATLLHLYKIPPSNPQKSIRLPPPLSMCLQPVCCWLVPYIPAYSILSCLTAVRLKWMRCWKKWGPSTEHCLKRHRMTLFWETLRECGSCLEAKCKRELHEGDSLRADRCMENNLVNTYMHCWSFGHRTSAMAVNTVQNIMYNYTYLNSISMPQ